MKLLIVIDMQNDFIDGSLGTKEAVAIVPNVATLSNPGVESFHLLNPENSKSERISITRVLD